MYGSASVYARLPHDLEERLAAQGSRTPSADEKYVIAEVSFDRFSCGIKPITGYLTAEEALPQLREAIELATQHRNKINSFQSFRVARQRYEKRNGRANLELMLLDRTADGRGALYNADGIRVDDRGRLTQDRLTITNDRALETLPTPEESTALTPLSTPSNERQGLRL